jgi:hypothetical protein
MNSATDGQVEKFTGVQTQLLQGLESTHDGHSRALTRTPAIGSHNGRSIATIN